jgi:hypothetical protein
VVPHAASLALLAATLGSRGTMHRDALVSGAMSERLDLGERKIRRCGICSPASSRAEAKEMSVASDGGARRSFAAGTPTPAVTGSGQGGTPCRVASSCLGCVADERHAAGV